MLTRIKLLVPSHLTGLKVKISKHCLNTCDLKPTPSFIRLTKVGNLAFKLPEMEQTKHKEGNPSDFPVVFGGFDSLFKEIIYSSWPLESSTERDEEL